MKATIIGSDLLQQNGSVKIMRGKFTVANESLSSVSVMSTCIKH